MCLLRGGEEAEAVTDALGDLVVGLRREAAHHLDHEEGDDHREGDLKDRDGDQSVPPLSKFKTIPVQRYRTIRAAQAKSCIRPPKWIPFREV